MPSKWRYCWLKSRVETHGALDAPELPPAAVPIDANGAKTGVGYSEIRIKGQRNIGLGLRPIEVLFEDCGQRRDKSRKRFVRVLFDRLFRVVFGKPQRDIRIITPTVLVVEIVRPY